MKEDTYLVADTQSAAPHSAPILPSNSDEVCNEARNSKRAYTMNVLARDEGPQHGGQPHTHRQGCPYSQGLRR